MLTLYVIGLILSFIIVFSQTVYILMQLKNRKNAPIWIAMIKMFVATLIIAAANIVCMLSRNSTVVNYAYGVYFASVDWLLICFLNYVNIYTNRTLTLKPLKLACHMIATVDSVGLVGNAIFGTHFILVRHQVEDDFVFFSEGLMPFNIHLALCYIMVAYIVGFLISKVVNSSGSNFIRYAIILIGFIVIIAVNAVFLFLDLFEFDISLYLYAILAVFVGFFTFKYNPRMYVDYMLSEVTEQLECGLLCFDEDGRVIYTNQLTNSIFEGEQLETRVEQWFADWVDGRDIRLIRNGTWTDIYEVYGEDRHFDVRFVKILDDKNEYRGCYFSFYDISKDVVALEKEKYRATHDPLTGALNREAFYEEAQKLIDYNEDTAFLIICSNIKNFKLINEVFGTETGDEILMRLAGMIGDAQTRKSVFARMEADRFALIMPKEAYKEETFINAMSILENFSEETTYRMKIHVGVCEVTDRKLDVAIMCDRAYLAIDSIKNSYQDRIAYYGEKLRNEYIDEQRIVSEFDGAIKSRQFVIYLQPQVGTESQIKGAEALVRWQHPQRGLLFPGRFMDVLEKTGYIGRLDAYIWEEACRLLVRWREIGIYNQKISINISPTDFYYLDVYKTITDLVERYNVDPKLLNLEITEAAFMADKEERLELLDSLRAYGFIIEMDDFGSGYSSLNMLKDMNIDVLKIDMAFLSKSDNTSKSHRIIKSIINLAKDLELAVITEGVENQEHVDFLTDAGCETFQGYYFDKPISVAEFEKKYLDIP